MTRPTSSPTPMMLGMPEAISDEKSTATPGIGCALNASWTALLVAGETSNWVSVNMTGATAALPSSDTSRIPDDISSSAAPASSLLRCASSCALPCVELGLLGRQFGRGLVERSGRLGLRPRGVELGLALRELGGRLLELRPPAAICCSWAARAACVANGSTTWATPSMSEAATMRALIAAFWASVRARRPPSGRRSCRCRRLPRGTLRRVAR